MDGNEVIEIFNESEPSIDITRNEVVYTDIPSEVIEEMQEDIAELQTDSGASILLSLNTTTYVLTLQLKNKAGTVVSTATVDFPIESVVVNGRYDSTNKTLILVLQNGTEISIPVSDLVSGLEDTANKVTSLSSSSTDTQYPSAKCVYDLVGDIESVLTALDVRRWNKWIKNGEKQQYHHAI